MTYIISTPDITELSHTELESKFAEYYGYLESVRKKLPKSAYDFATAVWHYDFGDHRSPHDAWLEEVIVDIKLQTEYPRVRSCNIRTRYLGAYQDGYIEIRYKDVYDYSVIDVHEWYYDEIYLNSMNHVVHEIIFDADSRWVIECRDISYKWVPSK